MKPAAKPSSPYRGLMPFDEADAPFFFGRARETRLICANLSAASLTVMYGSSGVGKTSILCAGVAPHLRSRPDVLVVMFDDWGGTNPLGGLKEAISLEAQRAGAAGGEEPPDASKPLPDYLASITEGLGCRLMIILDKFQEYMLFHPQDDDFAVEFPWAVAQSYAPVNFLISLRADALHLLDRFAGRIPTLFDNYLRVEHLDLAAAREAIVQPLRQYSRMYVAGAEEFNIEPECVEEILDELGTGSIALDSSGTGGSQDGSKNVRIETPFLQLVLMRLWDSEMRAGSRRLRLETLRALGGAERIVRTHMDHAMNEFDYTERDVAARIFRFLVTPSGLTIAHTLNDLSAYVELPREQLADVVNKLSSPEVRVLRPIAPLPGQPSAPRYEIFHGVLAPAVLDWRARHARQAAAVEAAREAKAHVEQIRKKEKIAMLVRFLILTLLSLATMTVLAVYAFRQQALAKRALAAAEAEQQRAEKARQSAEQALIELKAAQQEREDTIRKSAESEAALRKSKAGRHMANGRR